MPTIKITDNASVEITSQESTPALANYLETGLIFILDKTSSVFKQAAGKKISDIDSGGFPASISPSIPGSFAVSSATVSVKPGFEAILDLLTGSKAKNFLTSLGPGAPQPLGLVSFAITAELESGPSGTVGDFSFGLVSDQEIKISTSCPVAPTDLLTDAVQRAISGLTLPHDIDDIRALPEGHICTLEGKGSLKFTASVQYSFLNNTLLAAPFEVLSKSLTLNAESGPKLTVTVEHSNTHELTIAALGNNKCRLSISLTAEDDTEESFDFSLGLSGKIGGSDALQFIIEQVSKMPDEDLAQTRAILTSQEHSELSAQIKTAVEGATKAGITASLHDAFRESEQENSLFIYDLDLRALDSISTAAVQSALMGDFVQLTTLGSTLKGVMEVKSVSTVTLTKTHTLTLHLLGLLNFSDIGTFMKKAKVARIDGTSDVVFAATDIKIVQNTVDPDHLREVVTKSAMITTAADSSPKNPDFTFRMVFFWKKAGVNDSDLRQIVNSLVFLSSPDAAVAERLLDVSSGRRSDVFAYFSLTLDKALSTSAFKSRTSDDFVMAGQKAMKVILINDPESVDRLPLFSLDVTLWKQIRYAGAAANMERVLAEHGIACQASVSDFITIDWWAQAMANMANALAVGKSLANAEKDVLKDSDAGFDVPWALLATSILAPGAKATTQFVFSGAAPTARRTPVA